MVLDEESGLSQSSISLLLARDLSWNVYVFQKKFPTTCAHISSFSSTLTSPVTIATLISSLHSASLCPGNPDDHFVSICEKRGEELKKGNETTAYVDKSHVVAYNGQTFPCTVRRVSCELILKKEGRCQPCTSLRSTLRSAVWRNSVNGESRTSPSSHTNFHFLSPTEKDQRMRKQTLSRKLSNQQKQRIEEKVIKEQSITMQPDDADAISAIIRDVSPHVQERFSENSAQHVF